MVLRFKVEDYLFGDCRKGQSLVEVLVALSVIAIASLAIARAITSSVKSTRYSQEQNIANSLAQERISDEINARNLDPDSYFLAVPSVIFSFHPTGNPQYCIRTDISDETALIPTVPAGTPPPRMSGVQVTVFWGWSDSGSWTCDSSHTSSTYFQHSVSQRTYVTN